MFRQYTSPANAVGFIFGFMSYIISASPLPLIHKVGLFTILCVFTSLLALTISKLNDGEVEYAS
jgi:hypothetical protein